MSIIGYAYMNGDTGKMQPSPLMYASSTESYGTASEYETLMNGSETPSTEQTPQTDGGDGREKASPDTGGDATGNIHAESGFPLDKLKQMLSNQLDYYFSRENLSNDAYLLSQMDNDQYVPIWTVANFNQVKRLTKDIKLITDVLKESPNVQVDEEGLKVRPNRKRCIVILREIPETTPLEEVKGLFQGGDCPKVVSCEFAHNSSWYVTFNSDEEAQKAFRYLREEVRTFHGKPIMARMKAKPSNRLISASQGSAALVKNGYRNNGPAAAAAAAAAAATIGTIPAPIATNLYDPVQSFQNTPPVPQPPPPPHQRFLYANSGTMSPGNSALGYAGNQLQIYPFYHSNVVPWTATGHQPYFDFGNVFAVNGIGTPPPPPPPHYSKINNGRFTPRHNSGSGRGRGRPHMEHRHSFSESGYGSIMGTRSVSRSVSGGISATNIRILDPTGGNAGLYSNSNLANNRESAWPSQQQNASTAAPPAPPEHTILIRQRRRTKEDEMNESEDGQKDYREEEEGPHFEANAFPPLPAHLPSTTTATTPPSGSLSLDIPNSYNEGNSPNGTTEIVQDMIKMKVNDGESTSYSESPQSPLSPASQQDPPESPKPSSNHFSRMNSHKATPVRNESYGGKSSGDSTYKGGDVYAGASGFNSKRDSYDGMDDERKSTASSDTVVNDTDAGIGQKDGFYTSNRNSSFPCFIPPSYNNANNNKSAAAAAGNNRLSYAQVAQHSKEKAEEKSPSNNTAATYEERKKDVAANKSSNQRGSGGRYSSQEGGGGRGERYPRNDKEGAKGSAPRRDRRGT